jgi:hypothetical protein
VRTRVGRRAATGREGLDGVAASQPDHKVDHIVTRDPKQVKLVNSSVTGRSPRNGFWDSDHAGLFGTLKIYWLIDSMPAVDPGVVLVSGSVRGTGKLTPRADR